MPSESTVHYYWGIPFCPRGLDPDRYTQVGGAEQRWNSLKTVCLCAVAGESASAPSGDRRTDGGL